MQTEKSEFSRFSGANDETVSNFRLLVGEWFLRHKILLKKIGLGTLISFDVLTFGFGLFGWGKYFILDYWSDRRQMSEQVSLFQNYGELQQIYKANDFAVSNVQVFRSATNKYDFVAKVQNPNEKWYLKLIYRFSYSGGETESKEAIILPNTETPIAYFGLSSDIFPTSPQLKIESIVWKRVNPHKISDVNSFVTSRTLFNFDNLKFSKAVTTELGMPTNSVEFDLFNDSAYGYWDGYFFVELLNSGQIVGYIPLLIRQLNAGEFTHIDLRTFLDLTNVTDIRIYPMIDIFDESRYIQPGV